MKLKIQAKGDVSVKFRGQIGPIKWNKTVNQKVDQLFDITDLNLGGTHTLSVPGPADVIIGLNKETINGKVVNVLSAKVVADGTPWVFYETKVVVETQVEKTPPLRIRLNNVRGITADVTLQLKAG